MAEPDLAVQGPEALRAVELQNLGFFLAFGAAVVLTVVLPEAGQVEAMSASG